MWRLVMQVMSVACGTVIVVGVAILPFLEGVMVLLAALGLFILGFAWGVRMMQEEGGHDDTPVDRGGGSGGGSRTRLVPVPAQSLRKPRQLHLRGGFR